MTLSRHAAERIADRLSTLPAPVRAAVVRTIAADRTAGSRALCIPLPAMLGRAWSDVSNGDTCVAIIRDERVVTTMLRRRSQTFDPVRMGVDRVVWTAPIA